MDVQVLITGILQREGSEYTNNPKDSGGPTKYGITQATLSRYLGRPATIEDVRRLDEPTARQIYLRRYFIDPGFAEVAKVSPPIAEELTDTGVNCGPGRAVFMFQRALNGLNNGGSLWPDIKEDGEMGPATLRAFHALIRVRGLKGQTVMLRYLNGLQVAFYDDLSRRRPKDESFMFGWLLNRVVL